MSVLPVSDLLQLLAMNGRTGVLRLRGDGMGRVFLQEGRIVNALSGRASGRKALFRMLAWEDAEFHFDAGAEVSEPVAVEIHEPADSILVHGLVERDEMQHLKEDLPGLDQVLGAVAGAAGPADEGAASPAAADVERRVLALAAGAPTFLDVLDQLPESDVTIARAVKALLLRGALEAH